MVGLVSWSLDPYATETKLVNKKQPKQQHPFQQTMTRMEDDSRLETK